MNEPVARNEFIRTRASLLARLRESEDQAAWREFFDTYWPLLVSVSRRSGLSDADAQDVAQDVLGAVARQMPEFRYDPRGSFKAWLLTLTRRRIIRHWRAGEKDRDHRQERRNHAARNQSPSIEWCHRVP